MKDILDLVERTLGGGALQFIALALLAYYLVLGATKVFESIKSVASRKASLEVERARLEILKLECEIRALVQTHQLQGLENTLLAISSTAQRIDAVRSTSVSRIAPFLLRGGRGGVVALYVVVGTLQLVGWLCCGVVLLAVRYAFSGYILSAAEIYVPLAALLVGGGALFQGLRGIGAGLRAHSRRGYLVLACLVGVVSLGSFLYAAWLQSI